MESSEAVSVDAATGQKSRTVGPRKRKRGKAHTSSKKPAIDPVDHETNDAPETKKVCKLKFMVWGSMQVKRIKSAYFLLSK